MEYPLVYIDLQLITTSTNQDLSHFFRTGLSSGTPKRCKAKVVPVQDRSFLEGVYALSLLPMSRRRFPRPHAVDSKLTNSASLARVKRSILRRTFLLSHVGYWESRDSSSGGGGLNGGATLGAKDSPSLVSRYGRS